MATNYLTNEHRTNYSRLCRAIIDLSADVLRDLLNKQVLPIDILTEIRNIPDSTKVIGKDQWVYIHNAANLRTYEEFDITLLSSVIRLLSVRDVTSILQQSLQYQTLQTSVRQCPALSTDPKTKLSKQEERDLHSIIIANSFSHGKDKLLWKLYTHLCTSNQKLLHPTVPWGSLNMPDPAHITVGDDIERLRYIRNKAYGHVSTSEIPKKEFDTYWGHLEIVMARMDKEIPGKYYKAALDRIKVTCMDSELEKKFLVDIKKMSDCEKVIQEQVKAIEDGFIGIKEEVSGMKKDASGMKEDVSGMKADASEMKKDISGIKEDFSGMKDDVSGMKEDASGMREDISGMKDAVSGMKDAVSGMNEDASGMKDAVSELNEDVSGMKAEFPGMKEDLSGIKAEFSGMKEDVSGMKEDLSGLREDMQQVKGEKSQREKSAAEKSTLAEIRKHKESKTFVPSEGFRKGKAKLDEHGVLIYSGLPGNGKTENAIAIMESYQQEHPDWCFIKFSDLRHCSDIHCDVDSVILYDDCLGRTNTKRDVIDDGHTVWKQILSSVKAGKIRVIFTIRKNILVVNQPELEKYELFDEEHIIDLTTDEYKLTQDEKLAIFKAHCQQGKNKVDICEQRGDENYKMAKELGKGVPIKISIEAVLEIVKTDPVIGFPFACYLYTCHLKYIVQGVQFFRKPLQELGIEISRLKKIDSNLIEKFQFCTMGYMVLKGGHINLDDIDEDVFEQVCKSVRVDPPSNSQIVEAIQELNHRYLVGDDPNFTFKHQTVFESVAICFCEDNAPLVLKCCSQDFITEFIRTNNYKKSEGEVVVKLKPKHYNNLIHRFTDSLVNGNENEFDWYEWWVSHPVIDDKDFVDLFLSVIVSDEVYKKRIQDCVNLLFCDLFSYVCFYGKIHLLDGLYSKCKINIRTVNANVCYLNATMMGHTDIVVWLLDHEIGLDKAVRAISCTKTSTQMAVIMNHPNIKLGHLRQEVRIKSKLKKFVKCFNNEVINIVFNRWPDIDLETVSYLLINCCAFGYKESVVSIIGKRPDVTIQAVNEGFRCACLNGNLKVVNVLANHHLDLIKTPEILNEGFSLSCAGGQVEVLDFLIDIANKTKGFASQEKLNKGFTLVSPLTKQFLDLSNELKQNDEDLTNLHVAAYFGHHGVVKRLIDLEFEISNKTRSGLNVFMFAIIGLRLSRIDDFTESIQKYSKVLLHNCNYFKYLDPYFMGQVSRYIEVLLYLMQLKEFDLSDLDKTLDTSGSTLAHYCVVYDIVSVIELLLNIRPSLLFVRNKNKHRPIDLAVLMGRDKIFKLLYSKNTHPESNTDHSTTTQMQELFSQGIQYKGFRKYSLSKQIDFLNFLTIPHRKIDFGDYYNYTAIEEIISGLTLS